MSAPSYVPTDEVDAGPRAYVSPPRRPDSWTADRPGETVGLELPTGPAFGRQGPDQGYGLKLLERFRDQLVLGEGEEHEDVLAGCAGVALRRASLFARAPIVHDARMALTVFGFLDPVSADVLEWRRELFAEVAHPHHYLRARFIADLVPEETLRLPADAVTASFARDMITPLGKREAARVGDD